MTPRERLDAIEARKVAAAASSTASATEWWVARSRLAEKDVPDLLAFARAVLDAADEPDPDPRSVDGRFPLRGAIRAVADEHLGGES